MNNNKMLMIGYVRVSSVDQNEARQMVTMDKYNVTKVFTEKVSAKDTNRPQLQEMKKYIEAIYEMKKQEGKLFVVENGKSVKNTIANVVIHDFSRLARSTKDLLELVEYFEEKHVSLISAKESIDTDTPTGKLMLTMIGAINEFERANMLERQREGIAQAKNEGKYKGRKKVEVDCEIFEKAYERYLNRELTKTAFAQALNVSRPTLDKMIEHYKANQ